jgi:hypothetical protein
MPIDKKWTREWTKKAIKAKAPEEHGIYELGGDHPHADSEILYIGRSVSEHGLMSRLLDHHRQGKPGVSKFRFKRLDNARSEEVSSWLLATREQKADDMEDYHLSRHADKYGNIPLFNNRS